MQSRTRRAGQPAARTVERVAGGDRSARVAVLVALAIVAAAVAFAGRHSLRRDDPQLTLARELLTLAARGDAVSYRAEIVVTRDAPDGVHLVRDVTEWVRAQPRLVVTSDDATTTISDSTRTWVCTSIDGAASCLPAREGGVARAITPYGVAIASGRYRVVRDTAPGCWTLARRTGRAALGGIGDRLDTCFAPDGVVLSTVVAHDGVIDRRTVRSVVRRVDQAELDALARRATDGSVPVLTGR